MVFKKALGFLRKVNNSRKIKSEIQSHDSFKHHDEKPTQEYVNKCNSMYQDLLDNYIQPDLIETFKKNCGNGTYAWFINFCSEIILFKEKRVQNISDDFKFNVNTSHIFENYFIKEKIPNFISDELFISKLINTSKLRYNHLNKEYVNLLNFMFELYHYDSQVLDHVLEIKSFTITNNKFISLENAYSKFGFYTTLKEIKLLKYHYNIRLKIKKSKLDLNQIGRSLINSNQNFNLNDFEFLMESCDWTKDQPLVNSKIKFYNEGEYRFVIYRKNKPIYVVEILVVNENEVFIRQIQGVKGVYISPELNIQKLSVSFIEIWAKNLGFNLVTIYGSKCAYKRLYKRGIRDKIKKQVEENYNILAQNLGYKLNAENLWFKNI